MKTVGLLAGMVCALLAGAGCGGTVVFEEDGGSDGGGGSGSSVNGPTSTSVTTASSQGGSGPVSTVSTTVSTVGPGPGPTTTTGPGGCGQLFQQFGFGPDCNACMDAACCAELLACDVGTDCYACIIEGGPCTDAANAAIQELFGVCYPQNCQPVCEQCDFVCNDGQCIPSNWVCDGFPDCPQGEDEFCEEGICGSGVASGDQQLDQCLGDFCCEPFQACTIFGQDVEACYACLQSEGGGPLCDEAIECALGSPCLGEPPPPPPGKFPVCGGLSTDDPQFAECLNRECCRELESCVAGPDGQEGCVQCFESGGPLCDPVITCVEEECTFDGGG